MEIKSNNCKNPKCKYINIFNKCKKCIDNNNENSDIIDSYCCISFSMFNKNRFCKNKNLNNKY